MPTPPLVSIVLPVFNDEQWIEAALESCVRQTLAEIEIICVDDASTDATCDVIERFARTDERVRLIRQPRNLSAFQARRAGIMSATAPHILFLDGDDELDPRAAQKALATARAEDADLVGFGVAVFGPDGETIGGYQARLKHAHKRLEGEAVLAGLFPPGKPVQGQLWRYLFRTELLRDAYAKLPEDLVLTRVNDLPVTFLAVAGARRFVSVPDRLYRYFYRRGGSGHRVDELSQFDFYARGIASVESIEPAVRAIARTSPDPEPLLASYESARLSLIGNVLGYLMNSVSGDLYDECLTHLEERVPATDIVLAAAEYCREAVGLLARHGRRIELGEHPVRSVLLSTKSLTTGGVSLVLLAQAQKFLDAGYRVTVAAHRRDSVLDDLPDGVNFVEITGRRMSTRLAQWAEICRRESVDLIIDHQVLYSRVWPSFAVMARAAGVPTIGWVHSFSLRPLYDQNGLLTFIKEHVDALSTLVTLSPLDVAFWKLRGVDRAVYLPNPPSPMLVAAVERAAAPKKAPVGPIKLVWWGRLEQHTKRVRELIDVAVHLRGLGVDFRLTLIGPDSPRLTAADLMSEIRRRGLVENVEVVGPRHGEALLEAIDAADVFVSTSIIEGYQLTLAEAQARGLPVVMYELPWLTLVQGNEGILSVPHGDSDAFARRIAAIAADADHFERLSRASLDAAQRAASLDFADLYGKLITGGLPPAHSPEPTPDDARQIIEGMVFYTERGFAEAAEKAEQEPLPRPVVARQSPPDSPAMKRLRPAVRRAYRLIPGLKPLGRKVKRLLGRAAGVIRRLRKRVRRG